MTRRLVFSLEESDPSTSLKQRRHQLNRIKRKRWLLFIPTWILMMPLIVFVTWLINLKLTQVDLPERHSPLIAEQGVDVSAVFQAFPGVEVQTMRNEADSVYPRMVLVSFANRSSAQILKIPESLDWKAHHSEMIGVLEDAKGPTSSVSMDAGEGRICHVLDMPFLVCTWPLRGGVLTFQGYREQADSLFERTKVYQHEGSPETQMESLARLWQGWLQPVFILSLSFAWMTFFFAGLRWASSQPGLPRGASWSPQEMATAFETLRRSGGSHVQEADRGRTLYFHYGEEYETSPHSDIVGPVETKGKIRLKRSLSRNLRFRSSTAGKAHGHRSWSIQPFTGSLPDDGPYAFLVGEPGRIEWAEEHPTHQGIENSVALLSLMSGWAVHSDWF